MMCVGRLCDEPHVVHVVGQLAGMWVRLPIRFMQGCVRQITADSVIGDRLPPSLSSALVDEELIGQV